MFVIEIIANKKNNMKNSDSKYATNGLKTIFVWHNCYKKLFNNVLWDSAKDVRCKYFMA